MYVFGHLMCVADVFLTFGKAVVRGTRAPILVRLGEVSVAVEGTRRADMTPAMNVYQ